MICVMVFVLFTIQQASGVIYRLNETEYDRLPPLFYLDEFYPCLRARGDLYCYVDAQLVANTTSELLTMIQEYSAYTTTHYNHTVVHRGLCVTQTCRDYLGNSTDLEQTLEACLNATLYEQHQLQAKIVRDKIYCTKFEEKTEIDTGDCVFAVVALTLLMLNVVGSLYGYCGLSTSNHIGSKLLLCFSMKRNWQRLVMPSGEGPDPKLRRLKSFNGLKSITTMLVILGHCPLNAIVTTNNPDFIETTYHYPLYAILYNGTLIVQTFFLLSGFLLAYNILLLEEKRKIGWDMLPKGLVLRWLRLTVPYAAVLGFVSTWLRHFGNGPLWKPVLEVEVVDCRRDWFLNLLYFNNYVDNSQCMAHAWYLAADMQLSALGLVVFCLLTGARARKLAVSALIVVGLITPAAHTYLQNLHPILIVSPEVARNVFVTDPTFNNLYKRGHTNIVCYALGLAMAMLVHNIQEKNFDMLKYKRYRAFVWATLPLGVALIMTGGVFFIDGIQVPLVLRMVYSSAIKILFGITIFTAITAIIFKIENVYRGVLEWRGWAATGRVSYCAFLVHVSVIRTSIANHTSLVHSSLYQIVLNYLGVLVISYLIAVPFWMLIEAPSAQLIKVCVTPAPKGSNLKRNKSVTMATQVVVFGGKETIDVKL